MSAADFSSLPGPSNSAPAPAIGRAGKRNDVPNRRFGLAETIMDGAGHKIHARVNFNPRTGRAIEIFARTRTPAGSERDRALDDCAIMASKLLQEGVSLEALARAASPGGGIHAVLEWAKGLSDSLPIPAYSAEAAASAAKAGSNGEQPPAFGRDGKR